MANNSSQCIELLYEMVDTMTVANGYHFDWLPNKGGDKFFKATDRPKMYIKMGTEDNADEGGALGNNQYIDDLIFTLTSKATLTDSDLPPEEVDYKQDQLVALMRDDIKKRYSSAAYLCDARRTRPEIVFDTRTLRYQGSTPRIENEEGKFSTMRLDTVIVVKYMSERF